LPTFGEQLREAREKRGISLGEVSNSTKISERYLGALEGADLASLPGPVFNRGYVRTYATFLGLDPEPIVRSFAEYERRRQAGAADVRDVVQEMSRVLGPGPSRRPSVAVLGLTAIAIVGAVGAGWFFLFRSEPPIEHTPRAVPLLRQLPETKPMADPAPPPPEEVQPVATPEPPAESVEQPPVDPQITLEVIEAAVGTGIEQRQLVGEADRFVVGTRVHFWTRVVGGHAGDKIRHVWLHNGWEAGNIELSIGASHWRTHSTKLLPEAMQGDWVVEARDSAGRVLAKRRFACIAGPD